MTIRRYIFLSAAMAAIVFPLAAQELPPVTPRSVPSPPRIAGKNILEAKQAVDIFATRLTAEIEWMVQPGQNDQAEDKLEAKLDDIQDLVDEGKITVAQGALDEFHQMLANTSKKRNESLVASALNAVMRSHQTGDKGLGGIPDRATFERLSYQNTDGLIEPHLRGVEYVKFYIDGIKRNKPRLHFHGHHHVPLSQGVHACRWDADVSRMPGVLGADLMLGSLCYRPFLSARDGSRGLYTVEFGPHDVFPFAMIKLAYDKLVEHAPILKQSPRPIIRCPAR